MYYVIDHLEKISKFRKRLLNYIVGELKFKTKSIELINRNKLIKSLVDM